MRYNEEGRSRRRSICTLYRDKKLRIEKHQWAKGTTFCPSPYSYEIMYKEVGKMGRPHPMQSVA
jgi:hypothetical protein